MVFSSLIFLYFFLPLNLLLYYISGNLFYRNVLLTLFSFFFYAWGEPVWIILLLFSALFDYGNGIWIESLNNKAKAKWVVVFSVIVNLGLLVAFKYSGFIYDNLSLIFNLPFDKPTVTLPIGISFYTFQTISYTVDVYRGDVKAQRNPMNFLLFVSLYHQLVAGPIVRYKTIADEINGRKFQWDDFSSGIGRFCMGLFKKIVIANSAGELVDSYLINQFDLLNSATAWFGLTMFAIQIYFDFSGYSDMAIGLGKMFGFHYDENFKNPYAANSITDFWRRWHISLSSWLRDYLYISLGGNRKGKFRTYVNLFLTMLLGGLWHGAAIRFVIWGALHGLALIIHKLFISIFKFKIHNVFARGSLNILSWVLTFHFVCFCWIFFRADTMQTVGQVLNQIAFAFNGQIFIEFVEGYPVVLTLLCLGFIFHFTPLSFEHSMEKILTRSNFLVQALILVLVIILVVQFRSSDIQPFIYFQF